MDITGTIILDIILPEHNQGVKQRFYVINGFSDNKILLGKDFMVKFGSITFDFNSRRVRLGNKWVRSKSIQCDKKYTLVFRINRSCSSGKGFFG